mgnify:CR=1 FL=1
MFIVKETFIAKPGSAGKLAKLMKESMENVKARVMLDYVANYNTIVVEYEVKSLAEFDKMLSEYKNMKPEMKAKMSGYTELYQTGKREIFQVVE